MLGKRIAVASGGPAAEDSVAASTLTFSEATSAVEAEEEEEEDAIPPSTLPVPDAASAEEELDAGALLLS